MSIVKLPKMGKKEIEQLIQDQILCRIAFKGSKYPYLAPFQYAYIRGCFYFHFTDYGKKMKLLERDNRVAVEIETYKPDLSTFNFVVIRGNLEVVRNSEERAEVIQKLAEQGATRLSPNFLAAHGLEKEDGWDSLTPEKPFVILKLTEIFEITALKSP